jgi:hypothetical protein
MNTKEGKIYIDSTIPLEQQIAFLRRSALTFQFNTYEVLKEKLGSEGIEIFKTIVKKGTQQGIEGIKGKSFEEITKIAGIPDKILGLQVEQDYSTSDEFQYSITFCPYLEESTQRKMDREFCTIIEDIQIEEVSKHLGNMTDSTRMCRGDSKCTIKMRNTRS